MTVPYGMEKFLAKLHCTDRASEDDNFFIVISKTCNQGEYVRLRERQSVLQGSVPNLGQTCLTEWMIRIAVSPTTPPVNQFYGFWLRTLQPRGYARSQTKILSNSPIHETNHVRQSKFSEGLARVIHFAPLDISDRCDNSNVRWIKLSFDRNFDPVLWIANHKHSDQLKPIFDQAASSRSKSQMHQEIMQIRETDKEYMKYFSSEISDWRRLLREQGAFTMNIDRNKGLQGHIISALNLKISVQLQIRPSQDTAYAPDDDVSEPSSDAMMIWVVDMVDTGGLSLEDVDRQKEERVAERIRQEEERVAERNRQEKERREEESRQREEDRQTTKHVQRRCCLCLAIFSGLVTAATIITLHFGGK